MKYQKKPIPGYERWSIDTNGIVYGINGQPLSQRLHPRGYKCVNLGRTYLSAYVHRLVALTFLPNPENKPTVNHIDGNKTNNNVDNLEWASYYEQEVHKGLVLQQCQGVHQIQQLDKDTLEVIKTFNSMKEASNETGINYGNISSCCSGRIDYAGGYKWKKL